MSNPSPIDELCRGVVDLHTRADLEQRLASGKKLRVKAGFDPTRPDLHLGHTVQMRRLRAFQDAGHQAVLIIGDYTAMVGDRLETDIAGGKAAGIQTILVLSGISQLDDVAQANGLQPDFIFADIREITGKFFNG